MAYIVFDKLARDWVIMRSLDLVFGLGYVELTLAQHPNPFLYQKDTAKYLGKIRKIRMPFTLE